MISTFEEWLAALQNSGLLTAAQVEEVARLGRSRRWQEWDELFEILARRRLVSIYAGRKILQGKGGDLSFGPFVLLDKLGEGGMGKVYRARRQMDGTVVALKIVRPHLLNHPLIRRRYEREVAAALSLNHPNIVRVYEAGEHEGRHYLAMEFIDGIDLSRLGKEYRPLAIPEACEYIRQAALGLHHAHERGFVHRDIKPSNIIVAGERHLPQAVEPAMAKILDMGLVRAIGAAEEGIAPLELTREGVVVGTPDYMAPEQAKNSRQVDIRADLYSLGCTLYFLLAGRPPFAEGTAIEKILKHQLDPVPPLRECRPDVPPEVEKLVVRMLAKRPEERPSSALEVAQELERWCRYPFMLHPTPMVVRQQGHSSLSLGAATPPATTPPETESALRGPTDPQVTPPGPATCPVPMTPMVVPDKVKSRPTSASAASERQERTPVSPRKPERVVPPVRIGTSRHLPSGGHASRRQKLRKRKWLGIDQLLVVVVIVCLFLALMLAAAVTFLLQ
ncbi:MAG: serine/threonine protein kinase [Gemmataceae bacterium]|uniref:Serine/threonine protein kinase n=1 Tax=Thermogemmata fonticola TaxID=2755323 RepID=A0A7V8VCR9_9BACT|nr:serine/threonine-protein kinase [Thermogemmata fonticola]MBA2225460.1 serine/threonine protein kinase [Thermogemmata fonticola]MCX8138586.1 serine/threonine protein kinase [Gemmataceae bacterium]